MILSMSPSRTSLPVIVGAVLVVLASGYFALYPQPQPDTQLATCPLSTLPKQAAATVETILDGGPYLYPDSDNQRFGNYEGHLPQQELGYYREYTVPTPGAGHRGPRRIITGGEQSTWYYTGNHYETFCVIPNPGA